MTNKDELIKCITECIREELDVLNEPFVEHVCNTVTNSINKHCNEEVNDYDSERTELGNVRK